MISADTDKQGLIHITWCDEEEAKRGGQVLVTVHGVEMTALAKDNDGNLNLKIAMTGENFQAMLDRIIELEAMHGE